MNRINIKRLLMAGLAMFVAWIAVEIVLEQVVARLIFGQSLWEMMPQAVDVPEWTAFNIWLNILIALLNCTLLIWLYASLRPMYGVGVKAALITSAFGIVLLSLLSVNLTNLGLVPPRYALIEFIFEAVEFPLAMIAGAAVYEGDEKRAIFSPGTD